MNRFFLAAVLCLASTAILQAQVPSSKHVYIVAEENHSYESMVGSKSMPYLNSLIAKGSLATQFYANQHTSIADYFWLTSGQKVTTNENTTATYDVDNAVRHIMQLGLTYKVYAESLPYTGFSGISSGNYLKRHTALPYYVDMGNSKTQMQNLVSIGHLATDIQNGTLPNFAIITPNVTNDIHNCPYGLAACLSRADTWLKTHIAPLLARPEFQPGGDGLLVIWTDEADLNTDNRCSAKILNGCGGRVVVTMIGPKVKHGYQSTVTYHHPNLLRTVLMALGTTSNFPGASNSAAPMSDMFSTGANYGITIQTPKPNALVTSPVHVIASATSQYPIIATRIYVDNVSVYKTSSKNVDTYLTLNKGSHYMVVQNWDSNQKVTKKGENITVQ